MFYDAAHDHIILAAVTDKNMSSRWLGHQTPFKLVF